MANVARDFSVLGAMTAERSATLLASGLMGTLKLARGLVESGRTVELGGLDQDIGRLCAAALDLPGEQGRALSPMLGRLLLEASALEAALTVSEEMAPEDMPA